ncbi:MAG: 4'-phosphopantetheinyl transferase superfamily protein [Oscillospiraceae bacterium]|nr:4'-phosphopantetheinyl transferase superfamily protein [Oscillospiraceae bacterium]
MLYAFFELSAFDKTLYDHCMDRLPNFRKAAIRRFSLEKDKIRSLCAYLLLCGCTGRVWEEFSYNENGKPFLPSREFQFSLTHSSGCVGLALSEQDIGIDAETARKYHPGVPHRMFSTFEQEQITSCTNPQEMFFTLWTLKESYVKAIGRGLTFPLREIEFTVNENGIACSDDRFFCFSERHGNEFISACSLLRHGGMLKSVNLSELISMWEKAS